MKKCIVISDSFKGSLSSSEICDIARACFVEVLSDCELTAIPVADGGEGTCLLYTSIITSSLRTGHGCGGFLRRSLIGVHPKPIIKGFL